MNASKYLKKYLAGIFNTVNLFAIIVPISLYSTYYFFKSFHKIFLIKSIKRLLIALEFMYAFF